MKFTLKAKFKPTGDQPQAIKRLTANLKTGANHQVLLGVTGSGKTFTMANVIRNIQKPTLVISHNKTLAWQLYQEFKEFFPQNAVHYFVSYYDYYQPEAYIPQTDTYIDKDARINEEIDRMRHAATQDLLTRNDVIVVASVSCIYNIGSPDNYQSVSLELKQGQKISRKELLGHLVRLQYQRNDFDFRPGTFRARGDTIEIFSVTGAEIIGIELANKIIRRIWKQVAGDKNFEIGNLARLNFAATKFWRVKELEIRSLHLYPAHFWVTPENKLKISLGNIKLELQEQLNELKKQKKFLEAQRLSQRTNFDLAMMKENGWCHGIENYSRHLEFRDADDPPYTLIDYFKRNFLIFVDESHMTIPQLRGMYFGDRSRKETLVNYGFRLPSAVDNRPLKFDEFEKKVEQAIYVSATPGLYEMQKSQIPMTNDQSNPKSKILNSKLFVVEQLIRPTSLLEPSVEVKPTKNQVKNLIFEIKKRVAKKQRALVVTLTKRMAEDLAEYLINEGIKTNYLHSEIKTLERPEILRDLRLGEYDVIVGINLLREGLDLPEVSLIAIFDADKEGFLRNETTLIQTMGRAARHPEGHVIMYADKITGSMKRAVDEVNRRRKIQGEYNKRRGIIPRPIVKPILPTTPEDRTSNSIYRYFEISIEGSTSQTLKELEKEMKRAAKNLDFERATEIRDSIKQVENSFSKNHGA